MIGGTVIEYGENPRGGVFDFALYHCTTHGVTQEAVFDDSGTDMLYYKITVRVTGLVHGETGWTKYQKRQVPYSVSTAAEETRGLRASLDNRQTFRMRMGVTDDTNANSGKELVYAEPWPDSENPPVGGMLHWDCNDGPRCEVFSVEHVSGNSVFKVSATFTVCVVECDPASTGDPGTAKNNRTGILSNRWSSSDDIDANYLTTRTYSGRLKVASSKINPHLLRSVVVPPLLHGLRRDRMSFTVSVDGKTLDWTITDREVVTATPYPARTWDISHTVDTDTAMLSMCSCTVRLTGDRTSNPRQLIAIAFFVIREKLYSGNVGTITKRMSVQADTGDQNTVRVSCDVQAVPKKAQPAALTILAAYQTIGKPITLAQLQQQGGAAYNIDTSRGANPGDKIDIDGPVHLTGIFHARLQTPCDDDHNTDLRVAANSQNPAQWPPTQPQALVNSGDGPAVDLRIVDDVWSDGDATELSPGHITTPYTSYTSESLYDTVGMMAAMPIASVSMTTTPAPNQNSSSASPTAPILNSAAVDTTSTQDTVKVIRLSAPVSKRIVRVRAERVGDWPVMPKPVNYQLYGPYQVGQGNLPAGRAIVNDVKFLPGTTELTPTGQRIFRAAVDIEYLLTRPVDASQPLRVGVNPWDTIGLQLTAGVAMFADESTPSAAGV